MGLGILYFVRRSSAVGTLAWFIRVFGTREWWLLPKSCRNEGWFPFFPACRDVHVVWRERGMFPFPFLFPAASLQLNS